MALFKIISAESRSGSDAVELALDLTPQAITLYERAVFGGWKKFAAAPLDDPEFQIIIGLLRTEAETRVRGRQPIRLWLPREQVLKRRTHIAAESETERLLAAFDFIRRETVYRPEDVALAVAAPDRTGETTILVTFAETWREGREYAKRWGFVPGDVSTRHCAGDFGADGPVFRLLPEKKSNRIPFRRTHIALAGAVAASITGAVVMWSEWPFEPAPTVSTAADTEIQLAEAQRVVSEPEPRPSTAPEVSPIPAPSAAPREIPATPPPPEVVEEAAETPVYASDTPVLTPPRAGLALGRNEQPIADVAALAPVRGNVPVVSLTDPAVPAPLALIVAASEPPPLAADPVITRFVPGPAPLAPGAVEPLDVAGLSGPDTAHLVPEPIAAPPLVATALQPPPAAPAVEPEPEAVAVAETSPEPEPVAEAQLDPAIVTTEPPAVEPEPAAGTASTELTGAAPETVSADPLPVPIPLPRPPLARSSGTLLALVLPKPRPAELAARFESEPPPIDATTEAIAALTPEPEPAEGTPATVESPQPAAEIASVVPETVDTPVPGAEIEATPDDVDAMVADPGAPLEEIDPDAPTEYASLTSPMPPGRPALTTFTPTVPSVSILPSITGTAPRSVSAAATESGLPLDRASLIGILNLDTGRKALLRLPSGIYRSVIVGDVLDGWRVSMIGIDAMRITRGGEDRTFLLVDR